MLKERELLNAIMEFYSYKLNEKNDWVNGAF